MTMTVFRIGLVAAWVAAGISRAFGFVSDSCAVTRSFDRISTTNSPITVSALVTNGGSSPVRGFYYTEQIATGLQVSTLSVTLNGQPRTNYTFEVGADGDVYPGFTPYRWLLETPPFFTASNAIPANATATVVYVINSPAPGSFNLKDFSWIGYYQTQTNACFGFADTNQAQTVRFAPLNAASGLAHYDFTYPDRASFLTDGWDFLARTASGAPRDTEQATGAIVSFSQSAHPGTLRVPVDVGDLAAAQNNTRNSIFRNLAPNWSSMRISLAFAPTQNNQQAGVAAYQDDDNYVWIQRAFGVGNVITCRYEVDGVASVFATNFVTATTNMQLRLDHTTNDVISAAYSLDSGNTWAVMGSVTQAMSNPRMGLISGGSVNGFPNADFAWAEVLTPAAALITPRPVQLIGASFQEGQFSFQFSSQADVNYQVEYLDRFNGETWNVLTIVPGTGDFMSITDTAPSGTARFYRVRASQ